jgi:YidB-like protein
LVRSSALVLSRELAHKSDENKPDVPGMEGGVGGLWSASEGGFEEIIKSWIGTGPNKPISPNQLQQALGTVAGLGGLLGMVGDGPRLAGCPHGPHRIGGRRTGNVLEDRLAAGHGNGRA